MNMKNFITLFLSVSFMIWSIPAFALSEEESQDLRDARVQPSEPANAPKWTDYVPSKYENPRTDFTRKSATKELIWGGVLTDLIITAPVGIPMLCHGTTKLRNCNYSKKKEKFFKGLEEAKNIPEAEQEAYYKELLKNCGLKKKYID